MSLEHVPRKFLRRKAAAAYLKENYGFGATATLAKLASVGGGPRDDICGTHPAVHTQRLGHMGRVKAVRAGPEHVRTPPPLSRRSRARTNEYRPNARCDLVC